MVTSGGLGGFPAVSYGSKKMDLNKALEGLSTSSDASDKPKKKVVNLGKKSPSRKGK